MTFSALRPRIWQGTLKFAYQRFSICLAGTFLQTSWCPTLSAARCSGSNWPSIVLRKECLKYATLRKGPRNSEPRLRTSCTLVCSRGQMARGWESGYNLPQINCSAGDLETAWENWTLTSQGDSARSIPIWKWLFRWWPTCWQTMLPDKWIRTSWTGCTCMPMHCSIRWVLRDWWHFAWFFWSLSWVLQWNRGSAAAGFHHVIDPRDGDPGVGRSCCCHSSWHLPRLIEKREGGCLHRQSECASKHHQVQIPQP